jgi:hypothetical protein
MLDPIGKPLRLPITHQGRKRLAQLASACHWSMAQISLVSPQAAVAIGPHFRLVHRISEITPDRFGTYAQLPGDLPL